jgi:hypothetical protein
MLPFTQRYFYSSVAAFFVYILTSFCHFIWLIHLNPDFRSLLLTNSPIEVIASSFKIGGVLVLMAPLYWMATWPMRRRGMTLPRNTSRVAYSILFMIISCSLMALIFWPTNVETYLDQTLGVATQDRRIDFDFLISLKVVLEQSGLFLGLASAAFGFVFSRNSPKKFEH